MVRRADVYDALTLFWERTDEVARKVPRNARTARQHRFQVWQSLDALARLGMAERTREGNTVWWRRV